VEDQELGTPNDVTIDCFFSTTDGVWLPVTIHVMENAVAHDRESGGEGGEGAVSLAKPDATTREQEIDLTVTIHVDGLGLAEPVMLADLVNLPWPSPSITYPDPVCP
jgi:hypothetical protein